MGFRGARCCVQANIAETEPSGEPVKQLMGVSPLDPAPLDWEASQTAHALAMVFVGARPTIGLDGAKVCIATRCRDPFPWSSSRATGSQRLSLRAASKALNDGDIGHATTLAHGLKTPARPTLMQ